MVINLGTFLFVHQNKTTYPEHGLQASLDPWLGGYSQRPCINNSQVKHC